MNNSKLHLSDKVNYITLDSFNALLEYFDEREFRPIDSFDVNMIIKISYYLALRVNEALRLKKEDFDLELLEVDLGHTKTEEMGKATIPPDFKEELEAYLDSKSSGYLFVNRHSGKLIARQTVWKWLMEAGKYLNIPALTTPQAKTHEKTKTHLFRKSIGKDML